MATHADLWLNNQLSKAVYNHISPKTKSSQVTGRKINNVCYTLKSKNAKKLYPNIIFFPNPGIMLDSQKSIELKKLTGRSLSLNKLSLEKDYNEIKLTTPQGVIYI